MLFWWFCLSERSLVASIFDSVFVFVLACFFLWICDKNDQKRLQKINHGGHFYFPFSRVYRRSLFWCILVTLWFPFCSLCVPFWLPLAPFWLPLAPFWLTLAPFWFTLALFWVGFAHAEAAFSNFCCLLPSFYIF